MKTLSSFLQLKPTSVVLAAAAFAASALSTNAWAVQPTGPLPLKSESGFSWAEDACSPSESWYFSDEIANGTAASFNSSLKGGTAPNLRDSALFEVKMLLLGPAGEQRSFGRYWMGRLLWQNGLYLSAHEVFSALVRSHLESDQSVKSALGIQLAALQCMNRIAAQAPRIATPADLDLSKYRRYLKVLPREIVVVPIDSAFLALKSSLDLKHPNNKILPVGGSHYSLLRGLAAAKAQDFRGAALHFERFLAMKDLITEALDRYRDVANLMLGQIHHSQGRYAKAVAYFDDVRKDSNYVIEAVTEMTWAYSLLNDHVGALGTGLSLQKPALANVYAPDVHVASAISYYELCRFPEAYASLSRFRESYRPVYHWLRGWFKQVQAKESGVAASAPVPYQLAVDFLKDRNSEMPDRVGTSLIQSPVFLAGQTELNQIYEVRKALPSLKKSAFGFWRKTVESFEAKTAEREQRILSEVNLDLRKRMIGMYAHLDEIGITSEILEAETLRKAGDEVIWENIHPEFREFALSQKGKITPGVKGRFWDFGEAPAKGAEMEFWEDEIGSFRAKIASLCTVRKDYAGVSDTFLMLGASKHDQQSSNQ